MSSKYEKSVQLEEEGTYHRREVEPIQSNVKNYSTQSYQVVPARSKQTSIARQQTSDDDDNDNFEEWTTSKRKVNHKTRQVETRVSRQLVVEDGKVIADSGPQVTTRIKEDNKVEECEKEKAPKNKGKFDAIENACEGPDSTGRVLGEKKEIQRVSREVREENMQYHDERFKELTGQDVHRRAIQAPHELITITDKNSHAAPRGKMVHYSNKGKKYQDTDEILEVAKLAIDGSITKEVKRTKHHEEFSEDEKPDERGEAEALRKAPTVTRSSRRHVDYVNDFDDTSTPSCSSDDEHNDNSRAVRKHHHNPATESRRVHSHRVHSSPSNTKRHGSSSHETKHKTREDEAFPRYGIDPLLNSLNDDDFRPISNYDNARQSSSTGGRYKEDSHKTQEHFFERKDRADSNDSDASSDRGRTHHHHQHHHQQRERPQSPHVSTTYEPVEIPEEYRVNKQRLLSGKSNNKSGQQRERSFSPASKSHLSHASHRSSKSHRSRKEDASVQAHLTDEEEEKKSLRSSSSGLNSHEKTTKNLQRQSTVNSQRNYYFGDTRKNHSPSVYSSSSSDLSNQKEKLRRHGARSKDSGFRSPHSTARTTTPIQSTGSQQQIYSVSSKAKNRNRDQDRSGAISPTPTTGSVGQRSVKTTTTTMAAGLADRPMSPTKRSTNNNTSVKTPIKKDKRVVESGNGAKVSRTPSPFQKFARLFAPSSQKSKPIAT